MIEISINKGVKNFGFKSVLDEFNMEVDTGERIALIGPNGCGKTTLFNIIIGKEKLDSGQLSIRRGATIDLLTQIPPEVADDITVEDIILKNYKEIFEIDKKMKELENKMASQNCEDIDKILKSYGRLQEQYDNLGGYEIDEKVSKICNGFKIDKEMLARKYNSLSGGEKTIVNLASLIITEPNILLLDEPTNHLDIDTLEWFEDFLNNYKGTVVISSHDRYFLDKVTTKTILIDKGKADIYHGNYTYYMEESERRALSEFEDYKNQQKKIEAMKQAIKKLKEWGERGDNPTLFRRASCIERKLEKLELLDKPESKKQLPLGFEIDGRSGKDVIIIEDLSIMLGNKELLDKANMYLKYGEKVCIMGKNGTGKSTLIKAILNDDIPKSGIIKIGSNVNIGYIPQEIRFPDPNETVLGEARKAYNGDETHLRSSLAKFLFYGENVFKRVGKLSGGEKVRLKLFELIQKRANLLILDEPTNHIDIDTKEILEEALSDYKGTLLFVSHDRYFINKLAQRIENIENKKIINYIGNYNDYKICKEKETNKKKKIR